MYAFPESCSVDVEEAIANHLARGKLSPPVECEWQWGDDIETAERRGDAARDGLPVPVSMSTGKSTDSCVDVSAMTLLVDIDANV